LTRKRKTREPSDPLHAGPAVEEALDRVFNGPPELLADPEFTGKLQVIHRRKLEAKALLLDRLTRLKEAKRALQAVQDEEDRLLNAYLESGLPLFESREGPAAD
jgi:hypothetical protein